MTPRTAMLRARNCGIAIMAKSPKPGRSKTRLCPPLTFEQAASLSSAFLKDTSENLTLSTRFASIAGYAAFTPAGSETELAEHLAPETGLILADGTGVSAPGVEGFGRCLLNAVDGIFSLGHATACVLSSDTPNLPTQYLVTAARLLADGDERRVVLGGCDDGGYYLLGMNAPHAGLFADIAWSTDSVAQATRQRARALGLELFELPIWYDIDDAASLAQLTTDLGGLGYAAPATQRAILDLGLADVMQSTRAA